MPIDIADAARKFGAEVRRRRNQAGLSQTQLADQIPLAQSTISSIELGKTHTKRDQAARIDRVLTGGGKIIALWESQYDGFQVPAWVREVSELESRATEIRDYHPLVVPGLMQTGGYARAAIRAGNKGAADSEIDGLVAERLARQRIFDAELPPRVVAVIDESVFRRATGGPTVLAAQIDHLLSMMDRDRVEILVVPLETRSHPGMDGAFRLIRVPEVGDILWLETRVSGGPVEDADATSVHLGLFADLLGVALPVDGSRALLEKIKGDLK
ncbi:Scr1 family TA system antitoxin-like transcriptional regulator [Nocardiopsis sediminis]|uniref:Scr1 family TA system antitoxin-like transcriptional regulator n=1 Tax=Nocardiopsis sediminis TaxID=1778267 RepID=A0ABV8FWC3_9ACTN